MTITRQPITSLRRNKSGGIHIRNQTRRKREEWRISINKLIYIATGVAVGSSVLSVAFYLFMFHGGLSADHLAWGSFGSYLGGILGPIFSLLSFVGVVFTLVIERRRIAREAHDAELRHMLDQVDRRLTENHKQTINLIMTADYLKGVIQLPDWEEVKACFHFMSFCIDELNHSTYTPVTAYYSAIYGKVVKQLVTKGS